MTRAKDNISASSLDDVFQHAEEPKLPEGMLDRIVANATALPQIAVFDPEPVETAPAASVSKPAQPDNVRPIRRRRNALWIAAIGGSIAATIAAAVIFLPSAAHDAEIAVADKQNTDRDHSVASVTPADQSHAIKAEKTTAPAHPAAESGSPKSDIIAPAPNPVAPPAILPAPQTPESNLPAPAPTPLVAPIAPQMAQSEKPPAVPEPVSKSKDHGHSAQDEAYASNGSPSSGFPGDKTQNAPTSGLGITGGINSIPGSKSREGANGSSPSSGRDRGPGGRPRPF